MLKANDLKKSYGSLTAVDGVSLSFGPGQILGLLGPNGAGKTTTVSLLCGLARPDRGEVSIDGHSIKKDDDPLKLKIGLVPQELALYDELSARDNLTFFGSLYGLHGSALDRAMASALELVGLADRRRDRVKTFSGGMKRRLNLAAGLLHDPIYLLLDEPTVGVDPQSRNAIFDNLETLRQRGKALLYTTHYMEEAERLCDRIIIIDRGRVIADDTLAGLYRQLPAKNRLVIELDGDAASSARAASCIDAVRALASVKDATLEGDRLVVGVNDLVTAAPAVLQRLGEGGCRYTHVTTERGNLEAVFLALTGRSLRDAPAGVPSERASEAQRVGVGPHEQ